MPSNQYSKKEIAEKINTFFADNDEQGITAEDLRIVTNDYMNQSVQAPMLIYSGWWTQRSNRRGEYFSIKSQDGSRFSEYDGDPVFIKEKIVDTYFNPAFFRQHDPLKPTSNQNLWSVDTVAVPGASDGVKTIEPAGGGTMTRLLVTVKDNVITKLEIKDQGGNNIKGESYEQEIGGNKITFTYNSVINHNSSSSESQIFILTENPNRRSGEQGHSKMKTILQVSSQEYGQNSYVFMKEGNNVYFGGDTKTVRTKLPGGIKSTRYKEVTTPLQSTVTIWRVPRFN